MCSTHSKSQCFAFSGMCSSDITPQTNYFWGMFVFGLICYLEHAHGNQLLALSVQYLTNRFQVAMRLFSNRSQMMSKCGRNKKVAHEAQPSVSLMVLPHFDILCDLLLNRHMATWNLFVLYNKEFKKSFNDDVIYTPVLQ